jgi:hypothetical protein
MQSVTLHQQGTIHNLYSQSFPVVLDLEVTDDGHLSGFVNFYGDVRPDGFPLGNKFSIITDDPRGVLSKNFCISLFGLYTLRQRKCRVTLTAVVRNFKMSLQSQTFKLSWILALRRWLSKPPSKACQRMKTPSEGWRGCRKARSTVRKRMSDGG